MVGDHMKLAEGLEADRTVKAFDIVAEYPALFVAFSVTV
jgi:hypothetical protein